MMFPFGRRRPPPGLGLLDRLHTEIVAAVRRPALYLDYGVPDSFEGRFELLALHAGLVLRRFNAAAAPGPAVAQDLVDTVFAHLDADLREAGVGDITVPKRMKKLCEAFLGRSAAYDVALRAAPGTADGGAGTLAEVLARNVHAGRHSADDEPVSRLARYVAAAAWALDAAPFEACLAGPLPFPEPSAIA